MSKKLEEAKTLWNVSQLKIQELFEDYEELSKRDILFEDLTNLYQDIQTEITELKDQYNRYNLCLMPVTDTNKSEFDQIKSIRDKYRKWSAEVSERYNIALKRSNEQSQSTNQLTSAEIDMRMKELETCASASATAAASEIVKALTIKGESRSDLERLPCPVWDGKRTTYFTFKKHFNEAMGKNNQDTTKQLLRLRSAVKDPGNKWKRKIESASSIENAWILLDKEFTNEQKVIASMYQDLDNFKLNSNSPVSLTDFSINIREMIQQFSDMGRPQETSCEVFVEKLRSKLDKYNLETYKSHMSLKDKPQTAESLADWLDVMSTIKVDDSSKLTNHTSTQGHRSFSTYRRSNNNVCSRKADDVCILKCRFNHNLSACSKFMSMSVSQRWKVVRAHKLCRKCFELHHTNNCSQANDCNKCTQPHNSLLHDDNFRSGLNPTTPSFSPRAMGNTTSSMSRKANLNVISAQCPTQMLNITNANGDKVQARTFLDSGSDLCLLRKGFAKENGLHGNKMTLNMLLAGGGSQTELCEYFDIVVSPVDDDDAEKVIKVYTVNKPCSDAKTISRNSILKFQYLESILPKLEIEGGNIDLLIGTEFAEAFIDLSTKVGESGQPIAKKNLFGWYVLGKIDTKNEFTPSCHSIKSVTTEDFNDSKTMDDIKSMLYQDQVGIKPTKYCVCSDDVLEENRFIKLLNQSTKLIDGRIQVRMPWKKSGPPKCSNYNMVLKRMISTERSLQTKGKLEDVNKEVDKLEESGFVIQIPDKDIDHNQPEFYLPMHAVFTPGKSTEVRLVFDSSAKDHEGLSLNDRLEKGPNLINSLIEVLFAWRWDNVAYSGDIQKMFNQVMVHPDDQKYHRFVWRSSLNKKPNVYQWLRLNFGDKPSPPIASNSINVLAKFKESEYPDAAKELLDRAYVDDIAGSKSTPNSAKQITTDIDAILNQGHFKIKCWHSNDKTVDQSEKEYTDLLGHRWNKEQDTFTFKKTVIATDFLLFNKRKCLASLAQLWDPIGLVSAVTIKFKINMQELWSSGFSWDQVLPSELQKTWTDNVRIMNELLNTVCISRILKPNDAVGFPEIHGFCDAGELAYGAVIFLRWTLNNDEFVCIPLIIKSFVTPLKKKSIPRLELLGCLVLTRMYDSIIKALSFAGAHTFPKYLWCDSTTALKWIKIPPQKFRPFVSARVAEIQETIDVQHFEYICSELNPADALTRGIDVEKLTKWLEGPDFLKLPRDKWPDFESRDKKCRNVDDAMGKEMKPLHKEVNKKHCGINAVMQNPEVVSQNMVLEKLLVKCSSFTKIRRYLSYLIRFGRYLAKRNFQRGPLTVAELNHSQNVLFRWTQNDMEDKLQDNGIVAMPDENGVIRAHGRLERIRTLPRDQRNPIILPKNHRLVYLLIHHFHLKRAHCGYKRLMADIKSSFWIIGLRNMAKYLTRNCITCKKLRSKPLEQIMGQLPELRVAAGFPVFYNTALDMFGPVHIKFGRKTIKEAHVIIFTCMTSRAIHLELVSDKSSDSFLMAYRRFACLRGQAKCLWSDQGTNFVGAQTYLAEIMENWDINRLQNTLTETYSCELKTQWKWNVPHASHMNGVVESLIRSVRQAINATWKMHEYTEEQWHTILAETTYLINSRPLYPASNEIFEEPPITPNDILFGPHIIPPQPDIEDKINPRHLNRSAQTRVSEFWKCWHKYFAPNLLPRNKWYHSRENVQVGDVVLEIDTKVKRGQWKMAIVVGVYPGSDGKVRRVQIKTPQGVYDRPIHKLCLIASKNELENSK